MSDRALRRLARATATAMILAYAGEVWLLFATAGLPSTDPVDQAGPMLQAFEDLAFVTVGTLGLRVVLSQPRNAVGWLIMIAGLSFPVEGFTAELVQYGLDAWGLVPAVVAASWVSRWVWLLAAFNIPFLLLLFPDGHLPSRRWRPVLWLAVAVVMLGFFANAFIQEPKPIPGMPENPLAIGAFTPLYDALIFSVLLPGQYLLIALALTSLIVRYRRSEGIERQQIKVLIWVGPMALILFAVSGVFEWGPIWLAPVLNFVFSVGVAIALTLAILRYRLFEIDRLISRTVTYAIVAGALAVVYLIGAIWLPGRFTGGESPVFVAGSTLLVAAMFNPLRRWVMGWVDRRFNRARYDAEQIAEGFAALLREPVDADRLAGEWADVVAGALEPSKVGVWVREDRER